MAWVRVLIRDKNWLAIGSGVALGLGMSRTSYRVGVTVLGRVMVKAMVWFRVMVRANIKIKSRAGAMV